MIDEQSLVNNLGRLERRISELEASSASHTDKISDIRNRILNIKPNNELFIKIMRMQQEIAELGTRIGHAFEAINELEKKFGSQIGDTRESLDKLYKSIHGIAPNEPDKIWKELASILEWKDQIWGQVAELQGFAYNQSDEKWEKIKGIEDVLQVIIPTIKSFSVHYKNELLNKLEGKASGGEKTYKSLHDIPNDGCYHKLDGEKPPEPKRCVAVSLKNCMICGEDLTNEPRLEVYMCGHCADNFGNNGYIGVKREDLQWLWDCLDWVYIYEFNNGEKMENLKREYNI